MRCSIGITTGNAYCGSVGNEIRLRICHCGRIVSISGLPSLPASGNSVSVLYGCSPPCIFSDAGEGIVVFFCSLLSLFCVGSALSADQGHQRYLCDADTANFGRCRSQRGHGIHLIHGALRFKGQKYSVCYDVSPSPLSPLCFLLSLFFLPQSALVVSVMHVCVKFSSLSCVMILCKYVGLLAVASRAQIFSLICWTALRVPASRRTAMVGRQEEMKIGTRTESCPGVFCACGVGLCDLWCFSLTVCCLFLFFFQRLPNFSTPRTAIEKLDGHFH